MTAYFVQILHAGLPLWWAVGGGWSTAKQRSTLICRIRGLSSKDIFWHCVTIFVPHIGSSKLHISEEA